MDGAYHPAKRGSHGPVWLRLQIDVKGCIFTILTCNRSAVLDSSLAKLCKVGVEDMPI